MSASPTEPTVSDIEQSEHLDMTTVPVRVEGPVNARALPGVVGNHGRVFFASVDDVVLVLPEEPRRKRVVLVAKPNEVWIGTSQQQVAQELGTLLPVNVLTELTHGEEIWAKPETAGTNLLMFVHELWAR